MSSTRVRHSSSMQYTPRSNTHIDSSTQSNSTYRHGTKRKRNAPGQSSVEDIASAGSLSLHGAMYETTAPSYAHLDFSAWTEASLRKYGKTFALDSVLFGDAAASSPPLKKRMAPADTPAYTMTVSNLRGRPSKGEMMASRARSRSPQSERDALISAVSSHFKEQEIDEANVVADFLYCISHRDKKLRLPPHMLLLRQSS